VAGERNRESDIRSNKELILNITWNYADAREHVQSIDDGMPPVIITAAVTGGHQKSENPNVPVTAEEQAAAAAAGFAAGARIIHIHGREADDPTQDTNDPARYREINEMMRARAPEILIDNSQTVAELSTGTDGLIGSVYYYKSAPIEAGPDVMALNPGPMTFRGKPGTPSSVYTTTFDDTERTANILRERGIKPQVFLYHPGHLDLLEYLITHDALDKPYFVQLVFGQQSGIPLSLDSLLFMIRNLPPDCIFQACGGGVQQIQVNVLCLMLGGHIRTGMEDSLLYQLDEPVQSNAQLVERVVRFAHDLGRRVATVEETREMLGIQESAR
jgi:3-keto-5-aminohexanoate cleavage enzyme